MATRTYGKLHFDDLDPQRFEMMAMQIIFKMRRWEKLYHFGATGSDEGIDIEAVELLENGKRNTYHFQCKRYKSLTKNQIKKIINDYVLQNTKPADFYYIVCGCNVSKKAIDEFEAVCRKNGITHSFLWTASYLETLLYSEYHDILFAYFGINLSGARNNAIATVRRNVSMKKRMHNDFEKKHKGEQDIIAIRNGDYCRKFIHSEVLIRSIYDKCYPDNPIDTPGYYKTEVYNWYHNGLEVHAFPYAVRAMVKIPNFSTDSICDKVKDCKVEEHKLEVFGCIPFENIIEYDCDGDEFYRFPHLFCDYPCGSNPYEKIQYRMSDGYLIDNQDIVEFL